MKIQQKNKKTKKRLIILSIFLGLILALLIGCFYTLSKGISISRFKVVNVELKGLYLKLDNKLTLTLDELAIFKLRNETPIKIQQAIKWFQNSLVAISYFEKIEIKKIILPNIKTASIFYDGKQYFLDFPEFQALFQIQQNSQKINLKLQELIAQDLKSQINGEIDYFFAQGKIAFSLAVYATGEESSQLEKLIIKGDSNLQTLNLSAFSTPIANLALYEDELKKIPILYKWLMQKGSFQNIRIKNLFFSAPLDEDFVPKMLKSLYAEIDLENVALKLEPQLAPITTPFLKVKFQKNILSFNLNQPKYEGIRLDGSLVELHDLATPNTPIKTFIHLKSKEAMLDERVRKILQAYDIDFDVTQIDSTIDLDLKLTLQKINNKLDIQAQGLFKTVDSHFNLFGLPAFASNLNVSLELNDQIRTISIRDSQIQLQNPMTKGFLNCNIDLDRQMLQGTLNPILIQVNTSKNPKSPLEQIFYLNEGEMTPFSFSIDYMDTPIISIPDLALQITLGDSKKIALNNLSLLYPHSPLLQHLAIDYGEASIQTKDFENFLIEAKVSKLKYPIFDKKWNPIKDLWTNIEISPNHIKAHSLDKDMAMDYIDNTLKVSFKNKNFDMQKLINNQIPALTFNKKNLPQENTGSKTNFSLYLESKNSDIRYKNFTIPTDEIIVNLNDKKTTIDATHKNGVVNIDFYDDIIKFNANNFSGNLINLVAGKQIVQGGLFSAKGLYKKKVLRADIEMQNAIFKDFATLQNIIALIDTVPSLIVFKKPSFSTQGYQVNHGRVVLELNEQYLGLKKIDLIGDSIDVSGGGIVALDTQELNVSLTISTIKGLSEVLNKIPIVGYLLLGKEGKISTSLILKGTLQNPKSEVTLAQDILSAPFKIIERIFVPE